MNPTANKRKGAQWESDLVTALQENGWPRAERRRLAGTQDKGDVINGPEDWTLEAKNEKSMTLATYMKEAAAEAKNAGTRWYAAVVKRRNSSTLNGYVVMPLSVFLEVCQALEEGGLTTTHGKKQ